MWTSYVRNADAIADERRCLIDEVMEISERLGELAREEAQRFLDREEKTQKMSPQTQRRAGLCRTGVARQWPRRS